MKSLRCLRFPAAAAIGMLLTFAACDSSDPRDAGDDGTSSSSSTSATTRAAAAATPRSGGLFTETTAELGFDADPPRYPDGTFMAPEITPGGVAVFDYDNDDRLDILVVRHPAPAPWAEQVKAAAPNRLYRQQGDGSFKEVPNAAGLAGKGFHHGVAVGDVDNDGDADVYVCNYGGPDEFFVNNGDGSFADATERAGFVAAGKANPLLASQDNWSSTAAFFDFDADGHLDLWVAHFATFDATKKCKSTSNSDELEYCGPHTFPGQLATLYRNNGDGTFADVTKKAGINAAGRGWGVIAADLTGDGRADVLQANDEEPNQLWVNQGDGTFVDEALLRGCAFNAVGSVEANMGVHVGDVRNTGTALDIFITHISGETNTLWRDTDGAGGYADMTAAAGMGPVDRPFTGWGTGFFDYDNNGVLDLAVVNGRVARGPVRPEADVGPFWNRFAEPNLVFRGDGSGRFADVSDGAGDFTKALEVHRALAFADLHNRGAVDLVTVNLDNTLRVFRNDAAAGNGNHWLQVLPMIGKRDAIGAKVVVTAGGWKQAGLCLRAYSYLASNDPRVHIGLGKNDKVDSIEVAWPSGEPRRERFRVAGVDRVLVLRQGDGEPG